MKTKILIILLILIGLGLGELFVYKVLFLPEKPALPKEEIEEKAPEVIPEEVSKEAIEEKPPEDILQAVKKRLEAEETMKKELEKIEKAVPACGKIDDPIWRVYCEALALKDGERCNKLAYGYRERCYYQLAGAKRDVSICDAFEGEARVGCIGIASSNAELCKMAHPQVGENYCYYWLAAFSGNSTVCENIEGEFSRICKAVIEKNPSVCEESIWREDCLYSVAMLKGDSTICERDSIRNKQACRSLVNSLVNKDITNIDCSLTPDNDFCGLAAILTKDVSLCQQCSEYGEKRCRYFVPLRVTDALPLEVIYLDAWWCCI